MCNCGHDELNQAKDLQRRAQRAVMMVLFLAPIQLIAGKGHTPVIWTVLAVQVVLVSLAFWFAAQRRRILCGEAR